MSNQSLLPSSLLLLRGEEFKRSRGSSSCLHSEKEVQALRGLGVQKRIENMKDKRQSLI